MRFRSSLRRLAWTTLVLFQQLQKTSKGEYRGHSNALRSGRDNGGTVQLRLDGGAGVGAAWAGLRLERASLPGGDGEVDHSLGLLAAAGD